MNTPQLRTPSGSTRIQMNRLARSLAHPKSPRLFLPASQTTASHRPSLPLQLSPLKFARITSFATRPAPTLKPRMESPDPPPPPTAEDFVHIENPAAADPLSESIVNVEDELRREEEEARESANDDGSSGRMVAEEPRRGNVLPEELSRSVVQLTCESETGTCDVYLVGTAHVSLDSCREVQSVIEYLQPEVVFLELCASRVAVLTPQNLKIPTTAEMIEMYKKKHNMFGILYSWFLAKVASKLEVFPGSEFRVAYEEARKYGAKVILGDRPVQITLRRTWAKMPLWHKTKLVFSLVFQSFFLPSAEGLNKMLKEMDDVDMLTLVIQEMSKEFPTLMETLVHERDQYMSYKLYEIASEHSSVVAVVGKGHLQGIKKHWKQPVKMVDLMEMPTEKPTFSAKKVLATVGVGIAGVAIVSGLYLARKK